MTVQRVTSVDALRGLVMFTMIFVNDLAGVGKLAPDWMVHFSDRHPRESGMTFVDLVFPAFLFLVGMSVPLALSGRIGKGQSAWVSLGHVGVRSLSLLWIGILMVHETPDTAKLGWSGDWWCVLMYVTVMAAFSVWAPRGATGESQANGWRAVGRAVRLAGLAGSVWLALAYRGANGQTIIALQPISVDTQWYGILGLIGWAYLVTATVYLIFRTERTALLGSMTLLMCLFAADRKGAFDGFWLGSVVGIGGTLGSQAAISVGGLLLGSILGAPDMTALRARTRFTLLFAGGCAAAALLLERTYGISKNQATPSWCLWACAITALAWYGMHWIADVRGLPLFSRTLAQAGQNVLLAYLISMMLPSLLNVLGLGGGYDRLAANLPLAITRSALCGAAILALSVSLNRIGFRLRI